MQDEFPSIRQHTINNLAGGHRRTLSRYVDTDDPAKKKLLEILCHQLAIYQDCKSELNASGCVVEGPSGLKPHPAINISRNAADMVLRYMDKLGLGKAEAVKEIEDEIQKTIGFKVQG